MAYRERSHMTSGRFWQILPPLPPVSNCQHSATPPPLMTSAFAPPPISKWHKFFKEPPTLIGTQKVYLIQLKTERCQVNFMWIIILGEYINAVVSRIVIGPLDLKQFLPKFKYFCWRQQGLDPPCQQPSAFWNPLPLGCWRHMWTLPYQEDHLNI